MTPPNNPFEAPIKTDNVTRRYVAWAIVGYLAGLVAAIVWGPW